MVSKIELSEMKFYAYHGVAPQEKLVGNTFVVDLRLTVPLEAAIASDNLDDTINYASVYALIKEEMEQPSKLLEHAAGRILASLHLHFPQIQRIELRLSKQNPPFGGDIRCASIILDKAYGNLAEKD